MYKQISPILNLMRKPKQEPINAKAMMKHTCPGATEVQCKYSLWPKNCHLFLSSSLTLWLTFAVWLQYEAQEVLDIIFDEETGRSTKLGKKYLTLSRLEEEEVKVFETNEVRE